MIPRPLREHFAERAAQLRRELRFTSTTSSTTSKPTTKLEALLAGNTSRNAERYARAAEDALIARLTRDHEGHARALAKIRDLIAEAMRLGELVAIREALELAHEEQLRQAQKLVDARSPHTSEPMHPLLREKPEAPITREIGRDAQGFAAAAAARRAQNFTATAPRAPHRDGLRGELARVARMHFSEAPEASFVPVEEAAQEIVERAPASLRELAQRLVDRVLELYGNSNRVGAFVLGTDSAIVAQAMLLTAKAASQNLASKADGDLIRAGVAWIKRESEEWVQRDARLAFSATMNAGLSAGRFRCANVRELRTALPALRFDAVGDGSDAPNALALDGLVLRPDSRAWQRISPPLAWIDRSIVSYVSAAELERAGRLAPDGSVREDDVPTTGGADPNFRHAGRPDLATLGG
jgi:hypothetical protein